MAALVQRVVGEARLDEWLDQFVGVKPVYVPERKAQILVPGDFFVPSRREQERLRERRQNQFGVF
ncbi:MAG: hypothetical protein J6V65_00480, partial [Fibrobacterales bacterium]|nr:hypothetical protein [Fibrobacterales bacterium]